MKELKAAIQEDAATIRETDLDRVGGFHAVQVSMTNLVGLVEGADLVVDKTGTVSTKSIELFVDRLGRVILPVSYHTESLKTISVDGGPHQDVVRVEPRYEGETQVAWVCYLAERETNVEEPASKTN